MYFYTFDAFEKIPFTVWILIPTHCKWLALKQHCNVNQPPAFQQLWIEKKNGIVKRIRRLHHLFFNGSCKWTNTSTLKQVKWISKTHYHIIMVSVVNNYNNIQQSLFIFYMQKYDFGLTCCPSVVSVWNNSRFKKSTFSQSGPLN